ncbi:MAG: low molecular weight phosphotyrosine protein phosphatase [Halobacteriovoraceae bacterium]|nr:low molecular weight phosphotyrosine protein phosphatase [Halobacteriovoraceae bacterium]
MKRVLFVCLGNICRSPAAEGIMKKYITQQGMDALVECDSAGTANYHQGQLPDARMRKSAALRGFNLDSKARQFKRDDLDEFDYIIAMDKQNMEGIQAMIEKDHQRYQKKLHMMTSFCKSHTQTEVPDPYYSSSDGFNLVLDILDDAVDGLIRHIKKENTE